MFFLLLSCILVEPIEVLLLALAVIAQSDFAGANAARGAVVPLGGRCRRLVFGLLVIDENVALVLILILVVDVQVAPVESAQRQNRKLLVLLQVALRHLVLVVARDPLGRRFLGRSVVWRSDGSDCGRRLRRRQIRLEYLVDLLAQLIQLGAVVLVRRPRRGPGRWNARNVSVQLAPAVRCAHLERLLHQKLRRRTDRRVHLVPAVDHRLPYDARLHWRNFGRRRLRRIPQPVLFTHPLDLFRFLEFVPSFRIEELISVAGFFAFDNYPKRIRFMVVRLILIHLEMTRVADKSVGARRWGRSIHLAI